MSIPDSSSFRSSDSSSSFRSSISGLPSVSHSDLSNRSSEQQSDEGSSIRSQVDHPQLPEIPDQQPINNAGRKSLTEYRKKNVKLEDAPKELYEALRQKIDNLKAKTSRSPKEEKILTKLEKRFYKTLGHRLSPPTNEKELKKMQKQMHKELIALDAPQLTKWGKVASLAAGLLVGISLGVALTSNPVGWSLLVVGAVALAGTLLYQKSQETGLQSAKWAFGGMLAGLGGVLGAASIAGVGLSAVTISSSTIVGGVIIGATMSFWFNLMYFMVAWMLVDKFPKWSEG